MSERLDASMGAVISGMAAIPAHVREEALGRLAAIRRAVDDELIGEGTTILEFTDLGDDRMVLSMRILRDRAHLDVSTSEEARVVSNGYDFVTDGEEVMVVVDRSLRDSVVDHGERALRHRRTDEELARVEAARLAVASHPALRGA